MRKIFYSISALLLTLSCTAPADAGWNLFKRGGSSSDGSELGSSKPIAPSALGIKNLNFSTSVGGADEQPADGSIREKTPDGVSSNLVSPSIPTKMKSRPESLEQFYAGDRLQEDIRVPHAKTGGFIAGIKGLMPGGDKSTEGLGSSKPMNLNQLGINLGLPNLQPTQEGTKSMGGVNALDASKGGLLNPSRVLKSEQKMPTAAGSPDTPRMMEWQNKAPRLPDIRPGHKFLPSLNVFSKKMQQGPYGGRLSRTMYNWKMKRMQNRYFSANKSYMKKSKIAY